jgi:hypothetical protein
MQRLMQKINHAQRLNKGAFVDEDETFVRSTTATAGEGKRLRMNG